MKRLPLKAELLRAFLEGRKTVTRRLITPLPRHRIIHATDGNFYDANCIEPGKRVRPKYQPGDIVGIGEPWNIGETWNELTPNEWVQQMQEGGATPEEMRTWVHYLNDGASKFRGKVRTGRFLPDALVRHRARIVSVRAERLRWITEEDAKREGTGNIRHPKPGELRSPEQRLYVSVFREVWNDLHGKEAPWDTSPWVWRYEIAKVEPNA